MIDADGDQQGRAERTVCQMDQDPAMGVVVGPGELVAVGNLGAVDKNLAAVRQWSDQQRSIRGQVLLRDEGSKPGHPLRVGHVLALHCGKIDLLPDAVIQIRAGAQRQIPGVHPPRPVKRLQLLDLRSAAALLRPSRPRTRGGREGQQEQEAACCPAGKHAVRIPRPNWIETAETSC